MAGYTAGDHLHRAGSMREKYPLGRRRSGGDPQSHGGQQQGRWPVCLFFVLVGALVFAPYLVLGVVFSASILQPEEAGESGGFGTTRALVGETSESNVPFVKTIRNRANNLATGILSGSRSREDPPDAGAGGKGHNSAIEPGERDLCVGMAVGISAAQLVTFVASFREASPVAELVLFVDSPTSDRFKEIVDRYSAIVLEIDRERLEPEFLRRYYPSSARWVLIQRFLDVKGSDYERVLMVDAGDTFFQADPFDIIGDPGMYMFMEDKSISESATCSGWIKDCLGSPALAEVAHQKVTHSTVVLGTSSFAIKYARQMSEGLLSADFQACETVGVENGLHNYLLYTSGGEGVLRFDQFSGPVIDVEANMYMRVGLRVSNLGGREVPIVHRYLGDADFQADIFRRYVYWTMEDVQAVSTGHANLRKGVAPVSIPAACDGYKLTEGVDLFRARCDHSTTRVNSLGDCCAACSEWHACKAFSYDGNASLCYKKDCNQPGLAEGGAPSVTSGVKDF